ncbi:MAG: urease accessory protein UreD, partial [Nocardioidaceae bacterium]
MATTSIRVEADPDGRRPVVQLSTLGSGAMLRPRLVDLGGHTARVALVADGALLLSGDEIRIEVTVGSGVHLDLMEPAGTVAYDMRGGSARWDISLELLPEASVGWHGEPFVV